MVLLRTAAKYTLAVGLTNFFGEYQTDWGAVFARYIVAGLVGGMGK